ncbi:hypothetical protein NE237_025815 [Protea cynaroides]|uniref:Uncharacterized protein n=1 Tax=Protea cynaroides TaxID=273540 RepID=A0A9Q0H7Q9_9MAGN|nr:hypothetical protein NE237_025815 [Protea cynaroides]
MPNFRFLVEDATKVLEATNGTTLEKNGQILQVSYTKSIHGPGLGASGSSQSSSLATAAIEAATFAQQGWCFRFGRSLGQLKKTFVASIGSWKLEHHRFHQDLEKKRKERAKWLMGGASI